MNAFAIIMAGGKGERFWPASRARRPKQLLPIVGRGTLLQQTFRRIRPLIRPQNVFVITNAVQAPEVRRQLPQVPRANVIAEPMARNTTAAVGLGAAICGKTDPDAVMAVLPADHVIGDEEQYRRVLSACLELASREPKLVTIGIRPTEPNTGYGYIEVAETLEPGFHRAARFVEKPDLETAKEYLAAGRYRWNAGMFIWSHRTVMDSLGKVEPAMCEVFESFRAAWGTRRFAATLKRAYPRLKNISIDYSLMEKADNVVVADGEFDWDDVGAWTALANHITPDAAGNVVQGEHVGVESAGNIVVGGKRLIATLGVRGLIIVQTDDATLVCRKEDAQRIREVVKALDARGRKTLL
jgi:mannose-1-phosphate guanylyltransferase